MKFLINTLKMLALLPILVVPSITLGACSPSVTNNGCLNPITSSANVTSFIVNVLQVLVQVSIPVIAFFIVYTGFKFVAARGNESKLKNAKINFMYVIIGSALILGAWVFATLIGSTVSGLLT